MGQVRAEHFTTLQLSHIFFKQKTAYEIMPSLVGSEMCIRDRLESGKVFDPYLAHLGVIEFQQRGYPHAHLVYTFKSEGPQHLNEMDKRVWARIPDESIANGLLREKI